MADRNVDNPYDWKKRASISKMPYKNDLEITNNVGLVDYNHLNHLTSDDSRKGSSRINGMVECNTVPTTSRSGTEVRFINPAIYSESLNNGNEEHEVQIRLKVNTENDNEDHRCNGEDKGNCGDTSEMTDLLSTLSIKNDLVGTIGGDADDQVSRSAQETYRCYSFISPAATSSLDSTSVRSMSATSSKPVNRMERRCKIEDKPYMTNDNDLYSARKSEPEVQRYTFNGHRVVQISTTSFSSTSLSEGKSYGSDFARKIAHDEWIRKKQDAAKLKKEEESLAKRKREIEVDRLMREKEERESRERESFLKWSERKKKEEEKKKATIEGELELQKCLRDFEDKTALAKALCLRQWSRKKKEEEKARQKKEDIRQRLIDEDRKKRLDESTRAYEKWRETAKNKPKPATQGLLPHQKAKPAYINPIPWQGDIEDSEDVQQVTSSTKKNQSQVKNNSKRSVPSYQ